MVGSASPLGESPSGRGRAGPAAAAPAGLDAAGEPIPSARPFAGGAGLILLGTVLATLTLIALLVLTSATTEPPLIATLLLVGTVVMLGALALIMVKRMRALDQARAAAEARAEKAEAARTRAEAESRAKSRFLAEMSHELRTPLNTVMGFSEMMAQEVLGPHKVPAYAGYARDIHASGRHLLALADDLLDLARIESGHRILLETPVRLDLLGQDCLAMMRPEAAARGLSLALDAEAVQIWADERALRQMALNLLANAVKFTPPGGEVRLLAGRDAEGAPYLAVADTGPGISTGELPLGQGHARESRLDVTTGRGAGLGLAIVRGLAQLHDGEFTLVRRSSGGTLARISLPIARLMLLSPTLVPRAAEPAA